MSGDVWDDWDDVANWGHFGERETESSHGRCIHPGVFIRNNGMKIRRIVSEILLARVAPLARHEGNEDPVPRASCLVPRALSEGE